MKHTKVTLIGLCWLLALAAGRGAEEPRVAVMDFVQANSPGSLDPTMTDFSSAVQAALFTNGTYAWVERQEFDRITRETDLGGVGRTNAAAAVRLGHLLRADLLLRGEIAIKAAGHGELTVEAIDLKRAEVLASRTVPLALSAGQRFHPTAGEVAAASAAAIAALDDARRNLEQLRAMRVIAPLYFKNISRTDRAGFIEERLKEALVAAAGPATGTRVLRFPRASDAGEESSLVLAGLTDTDPDAWQQVANAYVWGTINEQGADGAVFEEVPLAIDLQVLIGTGELREVHWEGPVKALEIGLCSVAAGVLDAAKAVPNGKAPDPTGRRQIAETLRKRSDEVWQLIQKERNRVRPGGVSYTDFLTSTPGRQLFAYHLRTLEAACFFDPLNCSLQEARLEAAWVSNPADPLGTLRGHWLRVADYQAQARRFERQADGSMDPVWARRRTKQLLELVQALDRVPWDAKIRAGSSPEEIQRQLRTAFQRWGETVVAANQPAGGAKTAPATEEDNRGWMKDLAYLMDNSGDFITARSVVNQTWPVLQVAAGGLLKDSSDERRKQAFVNQMFSIYDAFGEFDRATAMMDAAWKVGKAAPPASASTRPRPPRRVDRPWQLTARPGGPPQMTMPPAAALPVLEATVREIEPWSTMAYYQLARSLTGLEKSRGRIIDSLAWQEGRLWIAESSRPLPLEVGPPNPQGTNYLWQYDPALHTSEYFTPKLGGHSAVRELLPTGKDLWLALDADGVWRRGTGDETVQRYKAEDGLTSPRMLAAQAGHNEIFFLGGTPPNYSVSRYSPATGKWSGIQVPSAGPLLPMSIPGVPPGLAGMMPGGPAVSLPQLAVWGEWLCVGTPATSLYNLTTNTWGDLLGVTPAPAGAPEAAPKMPVVRVFQTISADESGFWLGTLGHLLFVNPSNPDERKDIEVLGLPVGMAHHGPWLWVAVDGYTGASSLILIDKRTAKIVGTLPLPEGRMRKIVATDNRLWLGGSTLVEINLQEPRPAGASGQKDSLPDHRLMRTVWSGDATQVGAVLATKPDVNETASSGWSALMTAVEDGRIELVQRLLEAGANPNLLTKNGLSALQLAASRGDPALVEALLKHGAQADLHFPTKVRGLSAARQLVEDVTLPTEQNSNPPQPTGLKAQVTPDYEVVLSWEGHADSGTRYQITCDNAVVADLPPGTTRWLQTTPPVGESETTYRVWAVKGTAYIGPIENVPMITLALPKAPRQTW